MKTTPFYLLSPFLSLFIVRSCGLPDDQFKNVGSETRSVDYKLVAHRGGIVESLFDEFDPRSIQAAIDSGYYMLEMDVRPTKDKKIILHHDATLKRVYGVDATPEELTLEELKQLSAIRGGYSPMTFDEACRMCTGKVRFMMDVKPEMPEPWFYDELERIMTRYDMKESAYYIRNDVESIFKTGRFGFRMAEIPAMQERLDAGEQLTGKYYLFDHGNRLNGESVKWAQQHGFEVCASVNFGHYRNEPWQKAVERDCAHLLKLGVVMFQIDSDFIRYIQKPTNL